MDGITIFPESQEVGRVARSPTLPLQLVQKALNQTKVPFYPVKLKWCWSLICRGIAWSFPIKVSLPGKALSAIRNGIQWFTK